MHMEHDKIRDWEAWTERYVRCSTAKLGTGP